MKLRKKTLKSKVVTKTSQDKKVRRKVTKADYIDILEDAERWPISMRIAAELFRSGLSLEEFEAIHFETNGLSRRVYEEFMKMHLGKGYDPEKIHPVRPVYLRYVSKTAQAKEIEEGRPSRASALETVKTLIDKYKKAGWREQDFIQALRDWDDENEPPTIKLKIKDDVEIEKPSKRVQPIYMVKLGENWQKASSVKKAEELVERASDLERITPVKNPSTQCHCCKFPLSDTSVSMIQPDGEQINMHVSCYFMTMVHPSQLQEGMRVLSPPEGCYYVWHPVDTKGKGGWIKDEPVQKEETKETEPAGSDSTGVSASGGKANDPSTTVPVEASKGPEVREVSKEGGEGSVLQDSPSSSGSNRSGKKAAKKELAKKKPVRKKLSGGKRLLRKGLLPRSKNEVAPETSTSE